MDSGEVESSGGRCIIFSSGGRDVRFGNVAVAHALPGGLRLIYNTVADARPILAVEIAQP